MSKPPKKEFNLVERIQKLKDAGLTIEIPDKGVEDELEELASLPERIKLILGILQDKPQKATEMNYFILYDISNNKVRNLISKFLLKKGCIRVQKSVFLGHSNHKKFDEIRETLKEINEVYENKDSIILIPINISDARSIKLIGKNVDIDQIIDPPNTIFI